MLITIKQLECPAEHCPPHSSPAFLWMPALSDKGHLSPHTQLPVPKSKEVIYFSKKYEHIDSKLPLKREEPQGLVEAC